LARTGWGRRGIRRVAAALLERGTLDGDAVSALCEPRRAQPSELT
jgi:hypothetical protein